jgi:hypothetical protein
MRIAPVRPIHHRLQRLSHSSRLGWTMLSMLSLNSLSAFTQEVTRSAGIQRGRGPMDSPDAVQNASAPAQRVLQSAPPAAAAPPAGTNLPRGSLLDLRV